MINVISKKTISALSIAIATAGLSTASIAQDETVSATVNDAPCVQPAQPIIPDGNVASKEELVVASKAVKTLQSELEVYRNCLAGKSNAIVGEDDAATAQKQAIVDRYNESVDLEEKVAGDFNIAISAFKSK